MENEMVMAGVTRYEQFANIGDSYQLDYNNICGFKLYAVLNNPTENEIDNMIGRYDFTLAFSNINGVGILTFVFGELVGDAVIEPHICGNGEQMDEIPKGCGLSLNIIVVDSADGGLVKGMRVIGLGEEISNHIRTWYNKELKKPHDRTALMKKIEEIYHKYTSYDIIVRSEISWTLHL